MNNVSKFFNQCGNVLISDQFNNRVIETNDRGEIVWNYGLGPTNFTESSIIGVNDAQRIGELTLMAGTGIPAGLVAEAPAGVIDNRVILVDKCGNIIWQYGKFGQTGLGYNLLNVPVQCTFVPNKCHLNRIFNGTILITDQGNNRIIEVNQHKEIVRQIPDTTSTYTLSSPNSAEKLKNGNILIADQNNNRVIEISKHNTIVHTYTASGTLGACAFASRLKNKNTLITDAGNNRIVEVDSDDKIVWQYITNADYNSILLPSPTRALRLKNNNTIISDQFNNRVIIIDQTSNIVAYYGLPLLGGIGTIGDNSGYDLKTTQLGLYSPYDAKIIDDYTGITKPYYK